MGSELILLICALLAAIAIVGLFRPFLGLIVFLLIHFIQPGELIPAIAPLRLELVYGLLLIASLFFHRAKSSGPSLLSEPILRAAIPLLGAAVLSVPFSIWRGGAVNSLLGFVKVVSLMFIMVLLVDSEIRMRWMVWCLVLVAAWFAGSSLSAYAHGEYYALGSLDRAKGMNSIVGGPNELAGLLLAMLPLMIAALRTTRSVLGRIPILICGAGALAAIALTGSRTAMIGLLVMAIYYCVQSKHKILTFVACLLIACTIWSKLPPEYKQRYQTVESYAEGGQLDASNQLRLQIWKAGVVIFLGHPLFGVGAGQFPTAYGLIYLDGRHHAWMDPHNVLIQVGCELGIFGIAAFAYFVWQITKGIGFALRERNNPLMQFGYQMGVALQIMFLGDILLSCVGHTLYRPYWYVLGGLVAANRNILTAKLKVHNEETLESDSGILADDLATPAYAEMDWFQAESQWESPAQ